MIVPLHVKSYYSMGYGTASPEELARRAAEYGLAALALTDLDNLSGQPRFREACSRLDIRPITGVELRPAARQPGRRGRLVLLARDRRGYANLCRIITRRRGGAGREAELRAADPVTAVADSPGGLFALSDDLGVLEGLARAGAMPSSSLGALLVRPGADSRGDAAMRAAAHRLGIRLVADPDIITLDPADHSLHVLHVAIRSGRRVADVAASDEIESESRWFRDPEAAARLYADAPEAIAAAEEIAGACAFELSPGAPVVPAAEAFAGADPARALREACTGALARSRLGGRREPAAYRERLERELEVIEQLGYAGYFLAVAEIAGEARRRGIPLAVRGSAVGSLVIYLLGMSEIDPIERDLLFERFLHARRPSPPDIDLDACSERRDELLQWIYRRFGKERVAVVGAVHTFQLRSALREGLKAVGASRDAIDAIAAGLGPSEETGETVTPESLPLSRLPEPARRDVPAILRLVGAPRHLALHPGGLVISPDPVSAHVPVERGARGLTVAQYDIRAIEETGLVKLDVLGNKFLAQAAQIRALGGAPVAPADAATLRRLDRADTIGCYQVETPALRALLAKLQVRSMRDVAAALALVRPGAASGDAKRDFIRRMRGERPAAPVHPLLADKLRETAGLMLYDEDLMTVLSAVGGISLAEADELRVAIVDAGSSEQALAALARGFEMRAHSAGAPAELATSVWQTVSKFAAYSFSRAHAQSYAELAYASTYWKTHSPAAFACSLLNHYGGAYPLRTLVADLVRQGVSILPPSVVRSQVAATIEPSDAPAVRVGLAAIRHVSRRAVERVLRARDEAGPFRSVGDLLDRVRLARREVEALVLSGACDELEPLSPRADPMLHQELLRGLRGELSPQRFSATARELASRREPSARAEARRKLIRIQRELTHLDLHLTDHPMHVLRPEASRIGCLRSDEIRREAGAPRGSVRFAGILAASRRHPLGAGRAMQFLTFEDEAGLLEAVILPPAYPRLVDAVTTPGPYLVEGLPEADHGHVHLVISSLCPFHERADATRDA